MIGKRALWEIFHVLLGVAAAYVIADFSAWSYPLARVDIWVVAVIAMVVTAAMGVPPIRKAMAEDRAERLGD
jgi:type IV secretory pathway TrbD component